MNILKHCLNPKVLVGLAGVAIVLYFVAPGAALGGLPLLILLVCPLSMALMMWGMGKTGWHESGAHPRNAVVASAS
jgi:hypothetical protein